MGNKQFCRCTTTSNKPSLDESTIIEVYNNNFFIKGDLQFDKASTYRKIEIAASEFCSSNIAEMRTGIGIQYMDTVMRLLATNQQGVIAAVSSLSRKQRLEFLDRVLEINFDLMDSLYNHLILSGDSRRIQRIVEKASSAPNLYVGDIEIEDRISLIQRGLELLSSGQTAIVVMCGGASSRFKFQDKFLFTLDEGRQLQVLDILFERLRRNLQVSPKEKVKNLPIIILGNQGNIETIEIFMKERSSFHFENIHYSYIDSLPILNEDGKPCLTFEYGYLRRPKGSIAYIEQLLKPEVEKALKKAGVRYLHFVGTQNVMESPGDALFLGLSDSLNREVSIKCTKPRGQQQPFDRILKTKKSIELVSQKDIVSLSEHPKELLESCMAMNSMVFSLEFLSRVMEDFNRSIDIAQKYRKVQIEQNYYDFKMHKPVVEGKCFTFENDIKSMISLTKYPLLLRVSRQEFMPILTKDKEYSAVEAYEMFKRKQLFSKEQKWMGKSLHSNSSTRTK